jgi:hypothetical protein
MSTIFLLNHDSVKKVIALALLLRSAVAAIPVTVIPF